jgi:threonine synthase
VITYNSTRGSSNTLSFQDIILSGVADDGGLYLPNKTSLENLSYLTQEDLSYEDFVKTIFIALDKDAAPYVDELKLYPGFSTSPEPVLKEISDNKFVMELFHGPTKSFKDYALQPLGAIADKRLSELGERGLVVVATSGDTGSAAIEAVKSSKNIDIVVLHPSNKISEYQRKQMTSVTEPNVLNIAIEGSYDDCQRIVKEMLSKNPFNRRLISLNSINWLRVMGQVSYYVWLTNQFSSPINVAIPSGNFGNAYSAWFGRSHGLAINNILCSTNVNDVLNRFISSGTLEPQTTQPSIAPSMDIQIPSSLERLVFDLEGNTTSLYDSLVETQKFNLSADSIKKLQQVFSSKTFLDEEIKSEIVSIYEMSNIIFDPHSVTSIGMSLEQTDKLPTIAVCTASPEKFSESINSVISSYEVVNNPESESFLTLENTVSVVEEAIAASFQ